LKNQSTRENHHKKSDMSTKIIKWFILLYGGWKNS
jgi:hypothetical protein